MKNLFILSFTFLFAINSTLAQKISIDEAFQILTKNDSLISTKNVYYSDIMLTSKKKIIDFYTVESPDFESWFFFVDEKPYQNWEHPCYFAFVNTQTGDFKIIKSSFPPELENLKVKILQPIPVPGILFNLNKYKVGLKSVTTLNASNDYAVIISGGYNNENNWYRYWNDCSAIYSTLVNIYNYLPSHIYVLISDGINSGQDRVLSVSYNQQGNLIYTRDSSPLDLDGNGTNDIQYSATKSNVSTVFNTLTSILDSEDHLFVFTTDHGGQESGNDAYLYLWGETMRDDEFATELNKVHPGKMTVIMEQCYSGGFIDDISKNSRVISTACTASETSNAMNNLTYDEYVCHWISAVAGETPEGIIVDADNNNDGFVSMHEAFEYAENEDTQNETPQYNSTPNGLGCCVRLSENWNWYNSGPSVICSSGTFTVNSVPDGCTVTWNCSPNLTFDNQPGNPKTFYANGSGSGSVTATINSTNCGSVILPPKTVWVGPPNNSQITAVVMQGPPAGNQLCRNTEMTIAAGHPAIAVQGIYKFDWLFGSWNPYFVSYTNMGGVINRRATLNLSTSAPASQVITISAINGCPGTPFQKTFYAITCGYSMVFSPNPANDNTEVTLTNTDETDIVSYTVKVTNNSGQTLSVDKKSGKRFTLPTSSLKDGLYIVEVVKGNEVYRENLVVKH